MFGPLLNCIGPFFEVMMVKKIIVYFPENKTYGKIEFLKDTAYELVNTEDRFVFRWEKRGCTLNYDTKDFLPDPRFQLEQVKAVIKETVKKVEEKIKEVVKPKVEKTVKPVKKKPSKKVEKKDVAIQKQEL